jgi:nucleoside-diphosphate-sugar epimerase
LNSNSPDNFQGKRISLVGGAGFIGHHLALSLAKKGAEVQVVDSLQVNNLLALQSQYEDPAGRELYTRMIEERLALMRSLGVTLLVEDARDYARMNLVLNDFQPDTVVLLAAVAHAGRSNKDPYHTFDHSFRTLENVLDITRSRPETHFVYLSSSMVYGNFESSSVTEEAACNPIGIYGALKLGGEKLVIAYNQVFGVPYTILRPSALYGPRCISRRVIQVFIESALAGRPIVVDGDGSSSIDFTHIDDLVNGLQLALLRPEARNQIFNMTHGAAAPVSEVVTLLQGLIPNVIVQYQERDALTPERGTLDISKARDLLDYYPKTSVREGVPSYVDWYKSFSVENSNNR